MFSSDYANLQMSKARQEDFHKMARRERLAKEYLRLHPIKRRIRLPKITISWN